MSYFLALVVVFLALKVVHLIRKKVRFKMLKHYLEYVYMGDHVTTGDYGPLDDLTANGLIKEIKSNGGKILYHRTGTFNQVHDIIRARDTQLVESGLNQVIEKFYKENL